MRRKEALLIADRTEPNGNAHGVLVRARTEIVLHDLEEIEVLRGLRVQPDSAANRVVDVLHRRRLEDRDGDDFAIRQENLKIHRRPLIILLQSVGQEFLHGVALRYHAYRTDLLQVLFQTASSRVELLLAQSETQVNKLINTLIIRKFRLLSSDY